MTNKDYKRIASAINQAWCFYSKHEDEGAGAGYDALDGIACVVNNLCIELKENNPLFDEDKFTAACMAVPATKDKGVRL